MRTKCLGIEIDGSEHWLETAENRARLDEAASLLRAGGTVALPTETVYGLGANALDAEAVAKIFIAKERPRWDPLIVHVCDREMLERVVGEISSPAERLMAAFWPGPLTLLLPRSAQVSDAVTAGRPLVAVRMPAHPVALELIRRAGVPVAAPSANRFGYTSPTTAQHVLDDLDGRIDAVLDAGPTQCGVESTVLDPNQRPMVIYRPGAIACGQIEAVAGETVLWETEKIATEPREAMISPGVGLRHYAPRARVCLVDGNASALALAVDSGRSAGRKTGVMAAHGLAGETPALRARIDAGEVFLWGDWNKPAMLAERLYAGLRELDSRGCAVIVCPLPTGDGIEAAIRDRLYKAAFRGDTE
uniref:Threonylcarbamoyl-AMP synthase n=1 Tax=mine drainage metagenome TaxID=410659 RepID=E6QHP7_9ZZZZ